MPRYSHSWLLAGALAWTLVATRSHHFAAWTHLPDASWAVFFLAGFYLGQPRVFGGLLALAALSDYIAITHLGVSDFCISPAYGFLLPAYAALWLGGRGLARRSAKLVWLPIQAVAAASVAELLSSGGFYLFSGRFAEPSWAEFGARWSLYFPAALEGMAFYLAAALISHTVWVLMPRVFNGRHVRD